MLSDEQRQQAADALWAAERDRRPIEQQLTAIYPAIEVEDAYRIQLLNVERRVAQGGVVRGHKVGLTAKAMQEMFGVTEPDYGHLFDDMFVAEGSAVACSRYLQPRIEVEVGFVLGETLPTKGCTVADVLRATAFVCPALEIIDTRMGWKFKLCDTIADNGSSAGIVLGGKVTPVDQVDLRSIGAVLRRNGEVIDTGASGAVLGNPATAVAWLANEVGRFGLKLEAGHTIIPGSCTRAHDVGPGTVIRADFDVLGHVGVVFT